MTAKDALKRDNINNMTIDELALLLQKHQEEVKAMLLKHKQEIVSLFIEMKD